MTPILELAYKKHSDWNNIVKSFGCNPSMSEDVVMEMYIQLDADVKKGLDLLAKGKAVDYEGATGVNFTDVGEAFGSFLEKEVKGGKFKTKQQR